MQSHILHTVNSGFNHCIQVFGICESAFVCHYVLHWQVSLSCSLGATTQKGPLPEETGTKYHFSILKNKTKQKEVEIQEEDAKQSPSFSTVGFILCIGCFWHCFCPFFLVFG